MSNYTLRYYEKFGVLPAPRRSNGRLRIYSESDVELIVFISSLKKTGMSLKDIRDFLDDGCIMQRLTTGENIRAALEKRIEILEKHKKELKKQKAELDSIITMTSDKLDMYYTMLKNEEEKHYDAP